MGKDTEKLRRHLKEARADRAMLYALLCEELCARCGAVIAEEVMVAASYRRGLALGQRYAAYAPLDFAGLKDALLEFLPDRGGPPRPEVTRCDAGGLDIAFRACALKDTWQAAGIPEKAATLCRIATAVDYGTFEAAGFICRAETWRPGEEGCCSLHIRPGPPG